MKRELNLLRAELRRTQTELAVKSEELYKFESERSQLKAQIAAVSGVAHVNQDKNQELQRLQKRLDEKDSLLENQQSLLNQLADRFAEVKEEDRYNANLNRETEAEKADRMRLGKIIRHVVEVEGGKRYDFRGSYLADAMDGVDVRLGEMFGEWNARRAGGRSYDVY